MQVCEVVVDCISTHQIGYRRDKLCNYQKKEGPVLPRAPVLLVKENEQSGKRDE